MMGNNRLLSAVFSGGKMSTDRFISMLVAYYGIDVTREELRLTVISEYVAQYTDEQRRQIFNKAIASFVPTATNTFPIVVHFHGYMNTEADTSREAAEAWRQLALKSNRYHSIAIEDPKTVYALDRIGGWLTFCDRSHDGEVFMRNEFLKAYAMSKDSMCDNTPKLYHGELDNSDKRLIYLGNEEKIKIAIGNGINNNVQIGFDKYAEKLKGES